MSKSINILNELLVDTFNDILIIEQKAIKKEGLKDLSINEVHTIEAIGPYRKRSMSDVAKDLKITIGTLTASINRLVVKGYVKRSRSEEDRRVVNISLTEKGKLAYRIHEKFHEEMINEAISGLTEEEEEILVRSLEKVNRFFKKRYNL